MPSSSLLSLDDTRPEGVPLVPGGWGSGHLSEREPGFTIHEDGTWTRGPGWKAEHGAADAPWELL